MPFRPDAPRGRFRPDRVQSDDMEPSPSLGPTAQYTEPRGRNATADQIEKSLPIAGGVGLSLLAGPAILPAAGLAAAGGLAGKSLQGLLHAARTGEASENPLMDSFKEAAQQGGGALLGGALTKGLGYVAEKSGERFAKPIYRFIVGKLRGVNRSVVENVFNAAEDSAPTVAEAGKEFLEKIAGVERSARAAQSATARAGKEAVEGAKALSLVPQERALEAAKGLKLKGVDPQQVAESAASFSDKFNDSISSLYDDVIAKASKTKTIPVEKLFNAADDIEKSFMVGNIPVGKQSRDAVAAVQEWRDALVATAGPYGMGIPEDKALDLIRKLGKNTSWDGSSSKEVVSALRTLRGKWREALGESNPKLGASLREISEKLKAKEAFDDAFGLAYKPGFGTSPTDQTFTAVESVVKGRRPVSESAGMAVPGFGEKLEAAKARLKSEKTRESAVGLAEKYLKEAAERKSVAVRTAEQEAGAANSAAERFANQKRPDLLELRRAAESAATAGSGSPAEQALFEMMSPYLGRDASASVSRIITSASKEIFNRRPSVSATGRVAGGALTPQMEKLIQAIGKRIISGAQRVAPPISAAVSPAGYDAAAGAYENAQ